MYRRDVRNVPNGNRGPPLIREARRRVSEAEPEHLPMPETLAFIAAQVRHARVRPRRNSFGYRVPYLAVPLAALEAGTRHGLLSLGRFNLFAVNARDYGVPDKPAGIWVRDVLQQWQLHEADGEIVLVTMPRILGIAFNPVSFWLCFDRADGLRAVVAEVNNTFGERHFYVCCRDDHAPIAPADELTANKIFHVSPFMKVEGHYRFAFAWAPGKFGVRIDLHDDDGLLLTTAVAGKREPVTNARLALSFFANPLVMFKALTLIHYQAARLALKGIAAFRKPAPPAEIVSR